MTIELLDRQECSAIIASAESLGAWTSATVTLADGSIVDDSNRIASIFRERDHANHFALVRARMQQRFVLSSDLRPDFEIRPMQFVKYGPGGFYEAHYDRFADIENPRIVSVVCYLNDDFKGGGTTFVDADFTQAPKAGVAILFPADLLHAADAVISGTKYAVVTWLSYSDLSFVPT